MKFAPRSACLAAVLALCLASCATPGPSQDGIAALAPTGKLRVGLYTGSPTSYIKAEGSNPARGVGYDMGERLAKCAHVPFEPVVFPGNDKVFEAAKTGNVDLVFTNATPARAQFIDFTPPALEIEKSYLVPASSAIREISAIDRQGVRVGVSRGSSSEGELKQILKNATLLQMPSLDEAGKALSDGRLEAFGTNKAILFEMSDRLPGSRVLPGSWGLEGIAFGMPKGRPAAGLALLNRCVQQERDAGAVRAAAERAGVRGFAK